MENERRKDERRRPAAAETGKRRTSPAAREAQRQRAQQKAQRRQEGAEAARRRTARAEQADAAEAAPETEPRAPRAEQRPQRTEQRPAPVRREKRDSRAAQTAQRHREERKENERLSGLRQKQKRKAKQRTQKAMPVDVWKRLLIMAAVVAALALSMIIFFRVRNVEVRGNLFYSAEEISAATAIADGDNLLTISRGQVAGSVMAQLPYVESVQVTRRLPDTVIVTVTEFDTTYAVPDAAGTWYLMTSTGKLTEQVPELEAKAHIQVENLVLKDPAVGEQAVPSADEGKEDAARRRLETLLKLLKEIEAAGLVREVSSVNVMTTSSLSLWYGDRFQVELGDSSELAYKLEYLKLIIAEQKDYTTGTIDLSLSNGNEAYVIPNQ